LRQASASCRRGNPIPFVEILGPDTEPPTRRRIASGVTQAVIAAYAAAADTITIFFTPIAAEAYAHGGVYGTEGRPQRVLVKVHAFARTLPQRRRLAALLTECIASAHGIPSAEIAVYFLDRAPDEVAHGGRMACDEESGG